MSMTGASRERGGRAAADSLATIVRHPWSDGFSWRSPEPPFQVLDEGRAAQFDRDGFVVLESVVDIEMVWHVADEIDRYEAELGAFLSSQRDRSAAIAESASAAFMTHLAGRSPLLRALATHPVLEGLCADLVGPDVNLCWDQAVHRKPGPTRRIPWHQDNGYAYVEPQQYLTCWVALDDVTAETGCLWVVPGVHRQGTVRHRYIWPLGWGCFEDPAGAVPVPVGAGGVVVLSSLTPHTTSPHTADGVCRAYIAQYAPAGARLLLGDPLAGPPTGDRSCDDPALQFPVLRRGRAV